MKVKENLVTGMAFIALAGLLFMAFTFKPKYLMPFKFQCADCDNRAKTNSAQSENYDELHLPEEYIISAVYVKAGNACYVPDGICYNIVEGGIGYNFVKVQRLGSGPQCQGISHLEVCYDPISPTDTPTETQEVPTATDTPEDPTPSDEDTPTPTSTDTPDPSSTPTETPTPWPTVPPPPRGKG